MKHYEWGGYTKLSAYGSTLDDAMLRGSAYDKFVYKKWTFDASVSSEGMWRNKYKGNKTDILRNVAVGDGYYDKIMRKSATDKSKKRMNDQYAAVRAAYNGDKSYISHTLSYARTRVPNSYKNISTSFSDDVLPSSMASDINNSQSIAAAINGYYVFALSGGNTLMVDWSFSHSGNRRNTLYRLGTQPSILNGNKESVYTPGVTLFYSKNLKHNNTLRTMLSTYNTFYDTEYRGSYDGAQKLTSSEEMLFLEYMQSWSFGLSLYSRVGVSYVLGRVNGVNEISEVGPRLGLQLQYSINAKSTVGLEAWWANSSPQASTSNSAIVQSNEVMWLQGNPNLENAKGPMITATYNYIPCNVLSLYASVKYNRYAHASVYWFRTLPGYDGVVRTYSDDNNTQEMGASLSASLKLFRNKLSLLAKGNVDREINTGVHPVRNTCFSGTLQASYFLGRTSWTLYYVTPKKNISEGGYLTRLRCGYGLMMAYNIGDFNVNVGFRNWFSKGRAYKSYNSDVYSFNEWYWSVNYSWMLSATFTYTIPYGKKTRRYDDLENKASIKSAILE